MNAEYLATPWGDSIDRPTYADVLVFIEKIREADEEHGAFWVGMEDETALEVYQDLTVILSKAEDEQVRVRARDWEEVKSYYQLLLAGRTDFIK